MGEGGIPIRALARTGRDVTIFGLGGEGILRTNGEMARAVPMITRALDLGGAYFDTAPAYPSSRDYYGAGPHQSFAWRRRRELVMTEKELKLMAAAARMGLSRIPKNG